MSEKLKGLSVAQSYYVLNIESSCTPILLGYRGSIAHGTYVPNSSATSIDDKDLMGVYVAPLSHYVGFPKQRYEKAIERVFDPWDAVHYEVRKYVGLLVKANPNVLSLLWLHETDYVNVQPLGQLLIDNRETFVSKAAYHSFCGYARSQLTRMERGVHKGYMGEKRKAIADEFGYDTKNASHLIRLLRMGIEFLVDGHLQVKRPDAPELLAIKRGEWSLERVKAEADRLFARAEMAFINSSLPLKANVMEAETLVMQIVSELHGLLLAVHASGTEENEV